MISEDFINSWFKEIANEKAKRDAVKPHKGNSRRGRTDTKGRPLPAPLERKVREVKK